MFLSTLCLLFSLLKEMKLSKRPEGIGLWNINHQVCILLFCYGEVSFLSSGNIRGGWLFPSCYLFCWAHLAIQERWIQHLRQKEELSLPNPLQLEAPTWLWMITHCILPSDDWLWTWLWTCKRKHRGGEMEGRIVLPSVWKMAKRDSESSNQKLVLASQPLLPLRLHVCGLSTPYSL